jgi:hypothetical protein
MKRVHIERPKVQRERPWPEVLVLGPRDWEAIFFINVPVGIGVALAAERLLRPRRRRPAGGSTWAGRCLRPGSLVALIYALVEADSAGWDSTQTLGLFVLAATGIGAFVAVEGQVREPLVTLSAVRRRPTTLRCCC